MTIPGFWRLRDRSMPARDSSVRHPFRLCVLLTLAVLLAGLIHPMGQAVASQVEPVVVPVGQVGTAGPWQMTVGNVLTGTEAAAGIAVSATNRLPNEGEQFVLVEVSVTNTGDRAYRLDPGDFALAGPVWVSRPSDLVAPDPQLSGLIEPGASLTGAVALAGPTESPALVLIYDSLTLTGNWADAAFALSDAAAPGDAAGVPAPTDVGTTVDAAVTIGDPVATADWQVTVAEVVIGDPVYDLFPDADYRTTALGRVQAGDLGDADGDGAAGWVAVRVSVTYTGSSATGAYLSAGAFTLAQQDNGPVPNGLFLTAPDPEAEGWYASGQTREGWVLFEIQIAWDSDAMRFQAHRTDADVRYLTIYA